MISRSLARRMSAACFSTCQSKMTDQPFEVRDWKLGKQIFGIDIKQSVPQKTVDLIKKLVSEHRVLIFRNQGRVSAERHVEIGKWFGPPESTFYKHEKSEHPDVFRVSNDPTEGCTNVGRTGWHIDGSFQECPFSYSLYHMVHVPHDGGDTVFAPLTDLIERLDDAKRSKWERLYMMSDRRSGPIHPLIYSHPVTNKKVLCFHLGMTSDYVFDYKEPSERLATPDEFDEITQEIHHEFVKDNGSIQYSHKWEEGDFIISDNLAVGHEASPTTQWARDKIGLRVLHRVTIMGLHGPPKKNYAV